MSKYILSSLPDLLTICKLNADADVPAWATQGAFWSISRTEDELSIVCVQDNVPAGIQCEPDWRCLQVAGPLDFSLTGVLASLIAPLATAGISIFALSTFETDYLLIKAAHLARAIQVLQQAGHRIYDPTTPAPDKIAAQSGRAASGSDHPRG